MSADYQQRGWPFKSSSCKNRLVIAACMSFGTLIGVDALSVLAMFNLTTEEFFRSVSLQIGYPSLLVFYFMYFLLVIELNHGANLSPLSLGFTSLALL